jgi:pimeloyl-ACP methyl ester carboxylesterase
MSPTICRNEVKVMAVDRAVVDGVELEYELRGSGEPVVLIHWGVGAGWAEPLVGEPALADRYRLLTYDRAGFGRSGGVEGPLTMADHARHCRLLMRHVGLEHAHVVSHSSGVSVALQLALDFPEAVHTVVSMESARPTPPTELQSQFIHTFVEPAFQRYGAGDKAGAADTFMQGVFGAGYRPALDAGLPRGFEQAVADADAFFGQEFPALRAWSFTEDEAHRVTQPVLLVLGENSTPTFPERRDLLLSLLPNAEPVDLPDTTHLLHVQHPAAVAEALATFFARHPLG